MLSKIQQILESLQTSIEEGWTNMDTNNKMVVIGLELQMDLQEILDKLDSTDTSEAE